MRRKTERPHRPRRAQWTPRSLPRWLLALAVLTTTLVFVSACTGPARTDPDGARAGTAAGTLLTSRPVTDGAALPGAARTELITYVSRDSRNRPIVVSGTVSLPASPPPPGGWPVISWAHGTTGVADICAPSADTAGGPAHEYVSLVEATLDEWVRAGYVVVRTDYEGLGTPGPHPYLNTRSAANTVSDIVRAARSLDERVGADWVAMGHSQGGHAALSAAALRADDRAGNLLGAVAISPGGVGIGRTARYIATHPRGSSTALAFLPVVLLGAAAADPEVRPAQLLTPRARPLLSTARTGCLSAVRHVAESIPRAAVFRPDADLRALTEYLTDQDPRKLTPRVPVLIAQGTEDAATTKASTDALVRTLCDRSRITYEVYPGADHRGTIAASHGDAQRFVDALFAGRTPDRRC